MKTVKEKREMILRYVTFILRERMGGNDGIHKVIRIPPDGNSLRSDESPAPF
jgi:hypothetical protein